MYNIELRATANGPLLDRATATMVVTWCADVRGATTVEFLFVSYKNGS
jgi:hypothetical protein